MQFKAVLGKANHPEYGVVSLPFPIPKDQYDSDIEMLEALKIGDALKRDCRVEEIEHGWPILKRLEKVAVNIDELDYLAKRLDSFDAGEAAQFQSMAVKLGVSDMTDLINLTFCCQQATVITDFSDLNAIGRDHLMNRNGGCMPTAELDSADTRMAALKLILHEEGSVTPYGVVYDNGMKMEQLYNGQHFPAYYYEHCAMCVAMTHRDEPEDTKNITWLFLPMSQKQIERTMLRAGIPSYDEMRLRFESSELPDEVDVALDFESESLGSLNEMCRAVSELDSADLPKLAAAVSMAKPECAMQVQHLAEQLTRKQLLSTDQQWERLFDKLDGKEITSAGHLSARELSFEDEICEMDDRLNFMLNSGFDVDAAFGTFVVTDQNDDWLNIYANYDMSSGEVCDTLDIVLHRGDGADEELSYTLNAAEKEILLRKMDTYCQAQTGMTLVDYSTQRMAEDEPLKMEPTM